MKKLLVLFSVAMASMTGCNEGLVDYTGVVIYEIENLTGSDVTFIIDASTDPLRPREGKEIVIPNSETKEVFETHIRWSDANNDFPDIYGHPDESMFNSAFRLKVGDEFLPETIWTRRLWHFEAEPLRATYKLILTAELIELLVPNRAIF